MLDLFFALASLFLLSVPLALVAVFVLSAPFGAAMAYFVTEGPNGMTGFFQPGRGLNLGWPVGVQEEDSPGWKWQRATPGAAGPSRPPTIENPSFDGRDREPAPSAIRAGHSSYGIAPTRIRRIRVRFVRHNPNN